MILALVGGGLYLLSVPTAYIKALASAEFIKMEPANPGQPPPDSVMAVVGKTQVLLPVESLADVAGEINRTNKQLNTLEKMMARCSEKLSNRDFVEKRRILGEKRKGPVG